TLASELSQAQTKILDPDDENGPTKQIAQCEKQMADIRNALAGPAQKYQQYLTDVQEWQASRAAIEGTSETDDTLKFYEKQLNDCVEATKQIPTLLQKVIDKALEVYDDIVALAAVFGELYAPVQMFIEKHPLAKEQFHMSFEAKIVERGFADGLLSEIAQ